MRAGDLVLVGERDLGKPAHAGIEASVAEYWRETQRVVSIRWVATTLVTPTSVESIFGGATGVWCVPGSPYASTRGALLAIRQARLGPCAFLGTCGGFQHALMEYCGSVLGRAAGHEELDDNLEDPLITRLACSLAESRARVISEPGGWYARTTGSPDREEEFNCNYGMSPVCEEYFGSSDLEFIARDDCGQVRAFRLRRHPFFVGTLFQPEREALRGRLHPLVRAFLERVSEAQE